MKQVRHNAALSELLGQTLTKVQCTEGEDEAKFTTSSRETFILYHAQDCCESVLIEDVCGDPSDLIGSPIIMADESSSEKEAGYAHETWTFYRMATVDGTVVIRWLGESNGYYSEEVDLKVEAPE